jgi:type I restriction enzyme, R subunit
MTTNISESQFEKNIQSHLLNNGYIKGDNKDFNKEYVIDEKLFFQFIQDIQKEKWQKLQEINGEDIKEKILQAYQKEIESNSLIHVIRKGFSVSGVKLDCLFFKPESSMNKEAEPLYQKNILSIMRQVITTENNKPDIVLCLNGIPVATAELKNPATGQSFENAITQYKEDRDPKDKLFSFKRGALVHFAIDPHEVHMTTKLQKDKTHFLPFNKGRDQGQGNPDNPNGYSTSYLWEKIWQKDTWIEIISDFIDLQVIPQKYPLPDKENLIFPRYHQLDAVLQLTNATKENGTGKNYLIQHSTGSGKSNTIAWLAYKLLRLFDKNDKTVFDGVLILSDRVSIVNQLGNTVEQFEQTTGTADTMTKSKSLAENLEGQRKILISTQQKFPYVLDYISKVKGKHYALIIDEAHSSQSPESRKRIQEVLTTNLQEAEKQEGEIESQETDIVDQIEKDMEARGQQDTLSYYAFTATPKKKTLKLFGTPISDQDNIPFHTYSMKQAIQEGFILDVLKNYTTYDRQFRIVKTASEDKVVEGKKASRALLKYVDLHHLNLSTKSKIIVEHFRDHTLPKIGGLAKAMVVGSSRAQALKYKQEIDAYIKENNYQEIKTLVAFSGTLKDDEGNICTEQSMNCTRSDKELREKFDTKEYNILIVAEKYQTGFDQPLLHTMYVDKKLHGIKAVQTLSRINRTNTGKTDTFVIDFQNDIDEIYIAFKPYYEQTSLVDKTNQEYILNLYSMIMEFGIITQEDLDKFAEIFYKPESKQTDADHGRLYSITNPILTRFIDAEEKIQDDFRVKIKKYIESYLFISQIIKYDDTNLEKLSAVLKFIVNENLIKNVGSKIPELRGDVSLQWYRLEKTHEGGILLGEGGNLTMGISYGAPKSPEVLTSLSEVIRSLNEVFGGLAGAEKISLEGWFAEVKKDPILRDIAKANSFEEFFKQFEKRFLNVIISSDDANQTLVKRIYAEPDLQKQLVIGASQVYHGWIKSNGLPPITPTDPARNRQIFRQTIHQCKGKVNWLDLYLNEAGLDFMIDNFDRKSVKEIKLLTGLYDNEYSINEKLLSKFRAYKEELQKDGISLEFKLVASKEGHDRVAHDRYLLGENVKFNVVSFTLLQKGRFSEIKKTENDIPFDQYWNDSDVYDLEKDWDKIKGQVTFDSKCSDCGIDIQLPFKPDGKRPVYCRDCLQKHRK